MRKQLKKLLSALLALTMLLSVLPAAVLAEAGDVEPIATFVVEPIEEPIVDPTATLVPESTEEPAVEPAVEPTEEPTVEVTEEPIVEPTEEPIIEPTDESGEDQNEDVVLFSEEQLIQLLSLYANSGTPNEETLRSILQITTGARSVIYFGSADFDGDGIGEAFALVDVPVENATYMTEQKLVFITENGVKYLQTNENYADVDPFKIYDLTDVCLFVAEKYGTSATVKYVWAVENGDVVDLSKQFSGDINYEGGNLFTVYEDAYDGWADGTVHTRKPYYYYYENKQLKEYGGIYITEDELLEFEGAKEIIDEIKTSGLTITDIIYRSNGLIHINCQDRSYDVASNSYVTLSYDATSVTKKYRAEAFIALHRAIRLYTLMRLYILPRNLAPMKARTGKRTLINENIPIFH